jgi:hypothetical protein
MQTLFAGPAQVLVFVGLTLALGGGAAFLSGRALAKNWRTIGALPAYMLPLASFIRFLHHALFDETLLSAELFALDYASLLVFAGLGFLLTRRLQMHRQYGWLDTKPDSTPSNRL